MATTNSSSSAAQSALGASKRSNRLHHAANDQAPTPPAHLDVVTPLERQLLDEFEAFHERVSVELVPMLAALHFITEASRVLSAIDDQASLEHQGFGDTTLGVHMDGAVTAWREPLQLLCEGEMLPNFAGVVRRLGDEIANDCRFGRARIAAAQLATTEGD